MPKSGQAVSSAVHSVPTVCVGCSCLCDDIEAQLEQGRVTAVANACELGQAWFHTAADSAASPVGKPADLAAALSQAAEILRGARYPLVYGLEAEAAEAQREAVALAELLGGVIDTPTSSSHAASILASQEVGKVTCTLGEVRARCDLMVLWSADPLTTHPRLFSHYTLERPGLFVPRGRADRTLVVIDDRPTGTSALADQFIRVRGGGDFAALWTLRALVAGRPVDAQRVLEQTGQGLEVWQPLVERLKAARYGSLLYGSRLMAGNEGPHQVVAALALVRDLNAHTRFVGRSLRGPANSSGADQVLLWRSGYAYAVDFARGYPRFGPGEYTASAVLERGECDAALVVSSDPLAHLSAPAAERLRRLPLVYLGPPHGQTWEAAEVRIPTSTVGVHTGGVAYRMDEVPVALGPVQPSRLPSAAEVLRQLNQALSFARPYP
ncbi:MAG: formylmethanofuran dehydrogenase subunit B [Pirellulales bacterium]